MPHSKLTLQEAADYLHLHEEDLLYLCQKGKVPTFREQGRFMFRRSDIKDWAHQTLLEEKQPRLGKKNYSAKSLWSRSEGEEKFLYNYLYSYSLEPFLQAKTKRSLFNELVNLAGATGLLSDPTRLEKLLIDREEICSTGIKDGVAIPHPRLHLSDLFHDSFLVIARVPRGIPFGAADGKLSDLFFVPCAQTDPEHIFMLARLMNLLKKTDLAQSLREAQSGEEMSRIFKNCEEEWINSKK